MVICVGFVGGLVIVGRFSYCELLVGGGRGGYLDRVVAWERSRGVGIGSFGLFLVFLSRGSVGH